MAKSIESIAKDKKLLKEIIDASTRSESRKFTPLCDIDETIVNIRPKLARLMINDTTIPVHYFKTDVLENWRSLNKDDFAKVINNTTEYYLDRVLFTAETLATIPDTNKFVIDTYKKYQADFYDDLELTPLGEQLSRISDVAFDQIIFISHHDDRVPTESKARFIQKHFGDDAMLCFCDPNKKKSYYVNELVKGGINWDVFFDDRVEIIKDIITNTNIQGKQLSLINHPYNQSVLDDGVPLQNRFPLVTRFLNASFYALDPNRKSGVTLD